MLLPAYQAWVCCLQRSLRFGSFVMVERLQRLRLPLQCRDFRVWSLGCHIFFRVESESQRMTKEPHFLPKPLRY